jgi:hypothetical protein
LDPVPIAKLFIEGKLEAEVLNPILQGSPVLQRGGSKNSLPAAEGALVAVQRFTGRRGP